MKKLIIFFAVIATALPLVLSACKKVEDDCEIFL